MEDAWDDEDLALISRIAVAFMVSAVTVAIVGVAVVWNAVSLTSQAVQAVRRKP